MNRTTEQTEQPTWRLRRKIFLCWWICINKYILILKQQMCSSLLRMFRFNNHGNDEQGTVRARIILLVITYLLSCAQSHLPHCNIRIDTLWIGPFSYIKTFGTSNKIMQAIFRRASKAFCFKTSNFSSILFRNQRSTKSKTEQPTLH